ncbi:hypothetical protein GCM10018953_73680 [Streptosporangium nondiastaticum]
MCGERREDDRGERREADRPFPGRDGYGEGGSAPPGGTAGGTTGRPEGEAPHGTGDRPPRGRGRFGIEVNFPDHRSVPVHREASMEVLDGLADERLRLELLLIEALHREAERLAAQAGLT